MTTFLIKPIVAGRDATGWSDRYDYVAEAAAQAFKQGSPVVVTAGVASEAAANPALIDGFARNPGRNLTANETLANLPILRATEGRRYVGNLLDVLAPN